MDPELQCRVVEVETQLADGSGFSYSNGFAIDDERILTCAHGVDGAQAIRVCFLAVTGTPQLDARVVWNGFKHESQWDVAVLHIHDPSQVPDLVQRAARPLLSLREIGDGEAWSARGAFRASLVVDTTPDCRRSR